MSADSRRETLALAALVVVPLLPFLDAAVSLDAPVFLAVARQILVDPTDPFGFDMIWDPTSPHAALFNQNPPLLSYYLAPWIAFFGEREIALHAALLPFPLAAAFAFRGIARRVAGDGLAPAALLVATPAFVVLSTAILLDVPVLAAMLVSVYALLVASERAGRGERGGPVELLAGIAAAVAGLTKYVGLSALPLLAAGLVLLGPRTWRAALRVLGPPLVAWTLWGLLTAQRYGVPHFLGGADLVSDKSFEPDEFWNQLCSVPVYYGAALVFPVFAWARALRERARGPELAVAGLLAGTAVVTFVLPDGEPVRRVPLGADEAVIGALGFAGAFLLWSRALAPRRALATPIDRFLALWLGGLFVFSAFLNWHVNAADALLAAPPALLLLFRDRDARPPRRIAFVWVALSLALACGLAWADVRQNDFYREVARRIADEIGDRPGERWFVGHWGLQHYLEREGFRPVVPPQYERAYGRSEPSRGDWIASARNVSQLDVTRNLDRFAIEAVGSWERVTRWPLRTTNPDAGAGFYSHHAGYVPFAWSSAPLERVGLGRVVRGPPR